MPFDQGPALDQTQHAVAEVENEPHVVLDDHDRQALIADFEDQLLGLPGLLGFMPAVGSSSSNSLGSVASARAISSRR